MQVHSQGQQEEKGRGAAAAAAAGMEKKGEPLCGGVLGGIYS